MHVAGDRGRSEEDVEGKQSIGEDRVRIELLKTTALRVCLCEVRLVGLSCVGSVAEV